MRLLLDTHIALWAITNDPRLPSIARELIADHANVVMISAATLWEIGIKHGLSRGRPGDMPLSAAEAQREFDAAGYRHLPVTPAHTLAVEELPPIHADPFDRILVSQARTEPLRLITADATIGRYGDVVMLV